MTVSLIRIGRPPGKTPVQFLPTPDWMDDPARACAPGNGDPLMFTSEDRHELNQAANICRRRCPFLHECDRWADRHDEKFHVWGGRVRSSNQTPGEAEAA